MTPKHKDQCPPRGRTLTGHRSATRIPLLVDPCSWGGRGSLRRVAKAFDALEVLNQKESTSVHMGGMRYPVAQTAYLRA